MQHFDVLILGAGSAGCVLAARLSENPALQVALVEAGEAATDPDIANPQKWPALQGRAYDWAYRTTPQPGTAGRVHEWPRGRILGGSSCLHAMAHMRGHPDDFIAWAAAARSDRWSYKGLLPGFMRSEAYSGGASATRGGSGPMPVWMPGEALHPLVRAYMGACRARGIPDCADHNSGQMNGVTANALTIAQRRRVSAADAYLAPVMSRANLAVLTGLQADILLIAGNRIAGARLSGAQNATFISANVVILCLGSIGSPLLLMRSGIGPEAVLARAGVECRINLPWVGQNLQDHVLTAGLVYRTRQEIAPSQLQHSEAMTYINGSDLRLATGAPDMVIGCAVAPVVSEVFVAPAAGQCFTLLSGVTRPQSRGALAITGPSVCDAPLIDPAYFSAAHDCRVARQAFELARDIGQSAALADWRAAEVLPGPDYDDIDGFIQRAAITHHHPAGTCSLGDVVDADLRLAGFDNAFIVDASVIPSLPSGPIHAAVLAIAETFAADIAPDILH